MLRKEKIITELSRCFVPIDRKVLYAAKLAKLRPSILLIFVRDRTPISTAISLPHASSTPSSSLSALGCTSQHSLRVRDSKTTEAVETDEPAADDGSPPRTKIYKALAVLYYLLLLAQFLMCILEIVRLSLTHLGVGLLPFTFVALITAAAMRFTKGLRGRVYAWRYLNLALWVALAVTNGVKIAQETKEGTGARKGSKYPVADEITDVAVMIGVYAVLALLEITLSVWDVKRMAL
ncbi:MAG: hypothetical protein L6R36_009070 [Xanthoria steineri]|nr:MAG: hypothetical protein L6R36_009070 [Xanthoria steineri]